MISAIRLQLDLGLNNCLIIERASRYGGTWQHNTYPGEGGFAGIVEDILLTSIQ